MCLGKTLEKTTLLEGIQGGQRILERIRRETKESLQRIWQPYCTRRDRGTTNCSKRLGRSRQANCRTLLPLRRSLRVRMDAGGAGPMTMNERTCESSGAGGRREAAGVVFP